jgi:hypothetical protein
MLTLAGEEGGCLSTEEPLFGLCWYKVQMLTALLVQKSTNADTSSLCVDFAVLAKEQSEEEEQDAV